MLFSRLACAGHAALLHASQCPANVALNALSHKCTLLGRHAGAVAAPAHIAVLLLGPRKPAAAAQARHPQRSGSHRQRCVANFRVNILQARMGVPVTVLVGHRRVHTEPNVVLLDAVVCSKA